MIFLTADAFGILPPIARLTRDQAMYWFLSGFTAKLAGTEIGVKEPQPTFSACFGAPFLPSRRSSTPGCSRRGSTTHGAHVWLVNTGWTGGQYGEGSGCRSRRRAPFSAPRSPASWTASSTGRIEVFGFEVPVDVPDVDSKLLDPRGTWRDPEAYDAKARELAEMFRDNFTKFDADDNIVAGGPRG